MALIPRQARETEAPYVKEKYGVDFREYSHSEVDIKYFDTTFFHRGWLYNKHPNASKFADYDSSTVFVTNEFWIPKDFIIDYGRKLIRERAEKPDPTERNNPAVLPDNHHFSDKFFQTVENNISIRVDNASCIDAVFSMDVRRVTYFDQKSTNLAIYHNDFVGGYDLREMDSDPHFGGRKPKSFRDSMLANSLGVACIFELQSEENIFFPRFRPKKSKSGRKLAVMNEDAWHCSSSGVFEYLDLGLGLKQGDSVQIPLSRLEVGMKREILEEAGLVAGEDYHLEPLCFSREIPRAGKPQMFYRARLNAKKFRTIEDVVNRLRDAWKMEMWEYDDDALGTTKFYATISNIFYNHYSAISNTFTYEGFANMLFAK